MTGNVKLLINFVWKFMGTVCFGNDHVAAILGFEVAFRRNACFVRNLEGVDLLKGDCSTNLCTINLHEMASASPICLMARASSTKSWLWHQRLSHLFSDLQWGNILITWVYFVKGLGHNLFSVGQFCDSDLEVAFRRNACFVRNLEGVDLLKGDCSTNLYTINLHDMASASPICLMARASSTKLWLWHQRLSHLNFDTINDLTKNDLVSGLPKQRLHLLHMDLCGPMRIASINGKRWSPTGRMFNLNGKIIASSEFESQSDCSKGDNACNSNHMEPLIKWFPNATFSLAADYTQLYDNLKYNQKEVHELKAERLAKIQNPLALMVNSNNPYAFSATHQDQSSFNQNYLQQPMPNPKDITDSTTAMNMALALMAKAFKLNYSTPTNNNQSISSNPRNRQIAQPGINMGQDRQMQMVGGNGGNQFRQYAGQNAGNLNGYNTIQNVRNQNHIGNGNLVAVRAKGNAAGHNGNQIRSDLDEIEEVNANCILMANLQQASSSGTQTDNALVYDSDGSAEVHKYENCNNIEIFNMFTQEEQYTELLKPIPEPQQVPQNDNNVISEVTDVEQGRETVEQHSANFEETRALYDSLY
nr:retrovirus-related Pol polyprotein from transposon TNT 1-94 [Tanacetum cinerariifolium]